MGKERRRTDYTRRKYGGGMGANTAIHGFNTSLTVQGSGFVKVYQYTRYLSLFIVFKIAEEETALLLLRNLTAELSPIQFQAFCSSSYTTS